MQKELLTDGYRKEVLAVSPIQKRYYTLSMTLDDNIPFGTMETVLEDICDVTVKKVKDVTEWQLTTDLESPRDVHIIGSYKINGKTLRSNKIYLPRVFAKHSALDIELKLKQIFGQSFKIEGYREGY